MQQASAERPTVVLSAADFMWFVDDALHEMLAIAEQLGDRVNQRPQLAGANAPFAIVSHCLGVMEDWAGSICAGREITRDRDAEFRAEGSVDELRQGVEAARRRLLDDLVGIEPTASPRHAPDPEDRDLPFGRTQGGALVHLLRELTQHLGQLEVSRDVLLDAGSGRRDDGT